MADDKKKTADAETKADAKAAAEPKAAEQAENTPRRAVRPLTEPEGAVDGPGTNKYVRFDGHRDYPTITTIQAEIGGTIFRAGIWHEVSDDLDTAVRDTEDQGFMFTHRTGEATKRMIQESHEAAAPVAEAGMPGFNPQGHAPMGEGPGSGRAPVAGAGAGAAGATAGDGSTFGTTGSGGGGTFNVSSPSVGAAATGGGAGTAGTTGTTGT
jgi:hypothetical protein